MKIHLFILLFLFCYSNSTARPLTEQETARWHELNQQFRCPTCQNESIAESQVGLAADLRTEIKTQIAEGKSDEEIRAFMVARYGHFITYEPPLTPITALLWFIPLILIVLMLIGLWRKSHVSQQKKDIL